METAFRRTLGRLRRRLTRRAGSPRGAADPKPEEVGEAAIQALHASRQAWVRSLPAAERILDLGGSGLHDPHGALVGIGYPHDFERLVVVDLPLAQRHPIYRHGEEWTHVESPRGPVDYVYRSMADLDDFPDGQFDLVFCGDAIEHVPEPDGERALRHAYRLLAPGGLLALDTSNGPICRLQSPHELINPDHEVEYAHGDLLAMFRAAGFEVLQTKGLASMPETARTRIFRLEEIVEHPGVFDDAESCYLLAYLCRRPARGSSLHRA